MMRSLDVIDGFAWFIRENSCGRHIFTCFTVAAIAMQAFRRAGQLGKITVRGWLQPSCSLPHEATIAALSPRCQDA